MFAKVENGMVTEWPLREHDIQAAHPHTSFPSPISDEALTQFGFARFAYSDPATYDAEFQDAREVTPVLNGAVASQAWEIIEKYSAEEKAAYIAKRDAENEIAKAAQVRAERNSKLAASDWTQGKDIADAVSTPWATYRQALRDISDQAGFPWTVTWPEMP